MVGIRKLFTKDIKKIADKVGFDGLYYLCRDHGGPWQRDKEKWPFVCWWSNGVRKNLI